MKAVFDEKDNGLDNNVLFRAMHLVDGVKVEEYGDASDCFSMIAQFWTDYTGTIITTHDVAQMMILMKVARGRRGYAHENMVDIAGYVYCDEKLHK